MVVGQWKSVVSVSGAGLFYLAVVSDSATAGRTVAVRVIVDGVVLGTQSVTGAGSNSCSAAINFFVGHVSTVSYMNPGIPIPFLKSLEIQIKNDTDTTALTAGYTYTVSK
jgi:hypothetical protein